LKTAKVLACCLLVFPLVGTVRRSVPKTRAKTLTLTKQDSARRLPLQAGLRAGADLFAAGRYTEAQSRFQSTLTASLSLKQYDLAARATGNIGGCRFALHQYQPALESFLEARRLAETAGDASAAAALEANIASLYAEMGDLESAGRWMEGTVERLSGHDRPEHLSQLLIQMATLRARQGRRREAFEFFRQGIDGADRAGDLQLYALGWNRLGEELLKSGNLAAAESALLEAYRVRKLHRLPLDSSYRNLGRLRLAQGDLASASVLLDRAVELAAGPQGLMPTWDIYHSRGRVRLAQGRLPEALDDLRTAVRLARAWRWSSPAEDAARIGAEGMLEQVHSALIETGNRMYFETGDPALIHETFEAAEENRASSLRWLLNGNTAPAGLPPSYWEAMLRLQHAEVRALRSRAPVDESAAAANRVELDRLEASLGAGIGRLPQGLLGRARAALDRDAALLSFHLGDSVSWLWALDRDGLVLYALPPRRQIEPQIHQAVEAIRDDSPRAAEAGARLYQTLFGLLAPRFQRKSRWLLALDEALFEVPVAALMDTAGPRPAYVAERHITEIIPGAGSWVEAAARPSAAPSGRLLLGVGDPIYNTADPRLPARPRGISFPFSLNLFGASGSHETGGPALPRLVASSTELDACARAWPGEDVLLKGAAASRRNLVEQLQRKPAVVHFATHFLESAQRPVSGVIALSLTEQGRTEILTPSEIAQWRIHVGLVVLSGCHSAAGAALPGTGLLGLTRAWLTAGADDVIGSHWTTPDESGALFSALYRELPSASGPAASRGAARALAAAQRKMILSRDWHARPRYWGAWFVVGNE
jgi:CHAT domain-containing protein/tetratricopeptide (TPR) repeat protein